MFGDDCRSDGKVCTLSDGPRHGISTRPAASSLLRALCGRGLIRVLIVLIMLIGIGLVVLVVVILLGVARDGEDFVALVGFGEGHALRGSAGPLDFGHIRTDDLAGLHDGHDLVVFADHERTDK